MRKPTEESLLAAAKGILHKNWTGTFTKPAPSLYPHQWNWDAGFIAIGYAHFDLDKAEAELRHLFRAQWKNGMLPQIVFGQEAGARYFPGPDFWQTDQAAAAPEGVVTSGITMPPVHGFALWRMYEVSADPGRTKAFLREMYPKVLAFHRYLYRHRDPNDEALVYVRHPREPGTDNSPTWDRPLRRMKVQKDQLPAYQRQDLQNPKAAAHRPTDEDYDRFVFLVDLFRRNRYEEELLDELCPFKVQDPLFNAILAWSNECLIHIGSLLGENVEEPMHWHEHTIHSLNEKLWNEAEGCYDAYDLVAGERLPCRTNSGLMPLIGEVPTQEQAERILKKLESRAFCGQSPDEVYWCPTYDLRAADIDFEKYWRGPVWINMNWLLYQGLLRYDFDEAAERLRNDTLALLERYGFYEYFDPRRHSKTAEGFGTGQFSWSAALYIDLLSR